MGVQLHGKQFEKLISATAIAESVRKVAQELNAAYKGENGVVVLPVLNGAYVFAADLTRLLEFNFEVHFVKAQSYEGMRSSGDVKMNTSLPEGLAGRRVIILEDIIDTGRTVAFLEKELRNKAVLSIETCCLLYKPAALETGAQPSYFGVEIGNEFVVGYGLDYDGLGRGLPDIYRAEE